MAGFREVEVKIKGTYYCFLTVESITGYTFVHGVTHEERK